MLGWLPNPDNQCHTCHDIDVDTTSLYKETLLTRPFKGVITPHYLEMQAYEHDLPETIASWCSNSLTLHKYANYKWQRHTCYEPLILRR